MSSLIVCKQVVKVYRISSHEIVALRGIDFHMDQGEWVAIVGPSGAGKSSLLNLLGGLDTPTAGQLQVGEHNLLALKGRALAHYRLHQVGFVWQNVARNLLMHRSALGNVTLPLMLAGVSPWSRRKRARELLTAVGLADHAHKHPAELSGGQQQRVALAVALANRPTLLLADEPTGALDHASTKQAMTLLRDLRQQFGLTVLMVTHDLQVAAQADRVLTLRDGSLGQDLTGSSDQETPQFDDAGSLKLPEAARVQLAEATRIAVEVRPEGVLLRPEANEDSGDDLGTQDALPTPRHHWWQRRRR